MATGLHPNRDMRAPSVAPIPMDVSATMPGLAPHENVLGVSESELERRAAANAEAHEQLKRFKHWVGGPEHIPKAMGSAAAGAAADLANLATFNISKPYIEDYFSDLPGGAPSFLGDVPRGVYQALTNPWEVFGYEAEGGLQNILLSALGSKYAGGGYRTGPRALKHTPQLPPTPAEIPFSDIHPAGYVPPKKGFTVKEPYAVDLGEMAHGSPFNVADWSVEGYNPFGRAPSAGHITGAVPWKGFNNPMPPSGSLSPNPATWPIKVGPMLGANIKKPYAVEMGYNSGNIKGFNVLDWNVPKHFQHSSGLPGNPPITPNPFGRSPSLWQVQGQQPYVKGATPKMGTTQNPHPQLGGPPPPDIFGARGPGFGDYWGPPRPPHSRWDWTP